MTIRPASHNSNFAQVSDSVKTLLAENGWSDHKLVIESVLIKQDGELYNGLTVIRPDEGLLRPGQLDGDLLEYDTLLLVRERVSLTALVSRLNQMEEGTFTCGGKAATVKPGGTWSVEEYASGNIYESRGCMVASKKCQPSYGVPEIPLIHYSYPYFDSPIEAINAYCGVKLNQTNDARLNSIFIILPDARAYFDAMIIHDDTLSIKIAGSFVDKIHLRLKGQIRTTGTTGKVDSEVINGEARINVTDEIRSMTIWLIDNSNHIFDHYMEPIPYDITRSFAVSARGTRTSIDSILVNALSAGECETVEFKPFVKPGNPKEKELLKTIAAFSNTKGGVIVVGISNEAEIDGIEVGLRTLPDADTKDIKALIKKYVNLIKERVNHAVSGKPEVGYHGIEYGGHWLLIIKVEQAEQQPLYLIESKEIYVRRGANSTRAHPEIDLPRMYRNEEGGILESISYGISDRINSDI